MKESELTTAREKAARFRDLHRGLLILPNAWDAASARLFESTGFRAVGTTSAGIAFSLGLPDGERLQREAMLARVAEIARRVTVPVSADLEAGYGGTSEEVGETVRRTIEAGVVGINLEDGDPGRDGALIEVAVQTERLRAARETARTTGVPVFLNARTDVFWRGVREPEEGFEEVVRRASAYRTAGADGIFVPGVAEGTIIAELARRVGLPLNVLAAPGLPPVPELRRLGVARVSLGSGPIRAALGLLRRLSRELLTSGTYGSLLDEALSYGEATALFT